MKSFENKVTSLPKGESFMDYASLSIEVLNNRPQQGFSPEELMTRLGVIKKLKNTVEANITLEDAEAEKLLQGINEMNWGMLHEDIGTFTLDMRAALVKVLD